MDLYMEHLEQEFLDFDVLTLIKNLRRQIKDELLPSKTSMLPSHIRNLAKGDEQGEFLALDLGGSTFRAAIVRMLGRRDAPKILKSCSWAIDEAAKVTDSTTFFDWLAARIEEILIDFKSVGTWDCGLAFSFPIEETGINTGRIMLMGKGFRFSDDIETTCIQTLLDRAFQRRNLKINLIAIVNDSLATMISNNFEDPRTKLSLILGTGCNSSLCMDLRDYPNVKLGNSQAWTPQETAVLVNAEMSMFGGSVLPWTEHDRVLNASVDQPGYQTLEQFTSGRYMGELVRLILVDAIANHGFLSSQMPPSIESPYSFQTKTMSTLQSDNCADLRKSRAFLDKLHPRATNAYNEHEVRAIWHICHLVSTRSMMLICANLIALSTSVKREPGYDSNEFILVAYCGTVIERYPRYVEKCQGILDNLGSRLKLVQARESGLLGAAITAAFVSGTSVQTTVVPNVVSEAVKRVNQLHGRPNPYCPTEVVVAK